MGQDEPSPHRDYHRSLSQIGNDWPILPPHTSSQEEERHKEFAYRGRGLSSSPARGPARADGSSGNVDRGSRGSELPVPVIAGLVHYQLATIHPFNDGNGRTARLCADFILQRDGYGLNGFITPEEQYAEDLTATIRLSMSIQIIDYYEGRAEADLTPWLEYFILHWSRAARLLCGRWQNTMLQPPEK